MTTRALQHLIGTKRATAERLARRLELTDRTAELHGHPGQVQAKRDAARLRFALQSLYTELHSLEARLPTADTLSERAYNRALALGMEIDAAEAIRLHTYREAKGQRLAA